MSGFFERGGGRGGFSFFLVQPFYIPPLDFRWSLETKPGSYCNKVGSFGKEGIGEKGRSAFRAWRFFYGREGVSPKFGHGSWESAISEARQGDLPRFPVPGMFSDDFREAKIWPFVLLPPPVRVRKTKGE